MVLTLAPPAWMLQRLPMSSVHLLRFETSAASGPDRLSEVNFWLALDVAGVFWLLLLLDPGGWMLQSGSRDLGTVSNCTIGWLSWGKSSDSLYICPSIPTGSLILHRSFLSVLSRWDDYKIGDLKGWFLGAYKMAAWRGDLNTQPATCRYCNASCGGILVLPGQIFSLTKLHFSVTSLGVACKDDIPACRWEYRWRNRKRLNREKLL